MNTPPLHEFLLTNRAEILDRSRSKLTGRQIPAATESELREGLPLFLDQLTEILRVKKDERPVQHLGVSRSAAIHGEELLRMGLTVGQVVHDYGSICQSVTELADERDVAITADEFQIFNHCLDDAIAQAVTAYQHHRDQDAGGGLGGAHLEFLANEMSGLAATAIQTFNLLTKGDVGINGSTGTLHGRTLQRMRALVDRTLAAIRLEAGTQKVERVSVAQLIEEIEVGAKIEAKDLDMQLSFDLGPSGVAVDADHQILATVVMNLLQNAFKFTRPHGHVTVRVHTKGQRVLIDVEDECGGLPAGSAEKLFRPFEQHGVDRSGLGLGLSISLKGAQVSGGEIHVRDLPGAGCVFTVDLPRAPAA